MDITPLNNVSISSNAGRFQGIDFRNVTESNLESIPANRKIVMGHGPNKVTFVICTDKFKNIKNAMEYVRAMYEVVKKMNRLMPHGPVRVITLSDAYPEFFRHTNTVNMLFGDPPFEPAKKGRSAGKLFAFNIEYCREALCHELGHAVFYKMDEYRTDIEKKDQMATVPIEYRDSERKLKILENIYYFSFPGQNYEIYDDSNYVRGATDAVGHQEDATTEFFASAISTYVLYPEKLIAKINNGHTSADMRTVGIMTWCYLRDEIFGGRTFTIIDPFKDYKVDIMMKEIGPEEFERGRKAFTDFNMQEDWKKDNKIKDGNEKKLGK